jgi:xanthosine utilization system XapX-like protein
MSEQICQVCKEIFDGNTQTIELSDNKNKIHISGHISCTDELFDQIKNLNDYKKMSLSQILKEINLTI